MDTPCPHCDQTTPHTIEKYCPVCQETKPHTAYHKNKAQPSGLSSNCKDCRNAKNKTPEQREKNAAYMRGWNGEHRELINANALEAYYELKERREADPELDEHVRALIRAKSKRNRERHPEKAADAVHNYAQTNKPKINKTRRARYAKNPRKALAQNEKRRALRNNAPICDLTDEQWQGIKKYFNYRCVYCPPTCKDCRNKTHKLTQEHLTPLSKGGSHTLANVVPACRSCNGRRQNGEILNPVQPLLLL